MIALRLEFLAGRFHANPWDRGTNEGEVEWPPAPWRLLRALVACWYRIGSPDRDVFLRLLDALAPPPSYLLPYATAGHTRHYVPLGGFKNGAPEKTLILDSFIALERGREPVATGYVVWRDANIASEERSLLERICAAIGYLGRAESWCAVSVVDDPGERSELASIDVAAVSPAASGPIVRRLAANGVRGSELLRSLSESTADMRKARRLQPIGTQWAEYRLPPGHLQVLAQASQQSREAALMPPSILSFRVERLSGVLPPITQAVVVAEIMRRAVINRYSLINSKPATLRLAAKAEDGEGAATGHEHPYYLPIDSAGQGVVDRLDVWFPKGCDQEEYRAVASVSELRDRFLLEEPLALTFLGTSEPVESATWTTATPVVLDRFPKVRGPNRSRVIDAPIDQVRAMLERRYVVPFEVEVWPTSQTVAREGAHGIRLDAFRRRRPNKPILANPIVGATIRFDRPVSGPLALGRLAHFGLGQFRADPAI
jgi:CRISPR-associated protein Csb2